MPATTSQPAKHFSVKRNPKTGATTINGKRFRMSLEQFANWTAWVATNGNTFEFIK